MTVLSIAVFLLVLWKYAATRSGSLLAAAIAAQQPGTLRARGAAFALAALYAVQLASLVVQSRVDNLAPRYAWMKALPLPVFDDRASTAAPHGSFHAAFVALGLGLGCAETLALAVLVLALRYDRTSVSTGLIAVPACALGFLSLAVPAMSTTDPYEYAATGILGFHSYAPASGALAHTVYAAVATHVPLKGVIYGPLWVLVDIVLTRLGASVYAKIEAIRIANVAFIAIFSWLLARAQVGRAVLVAVVLNPALWYYTVANPHAEIEGLVLLAAGYDASRRGRTPVATAFVALAGLIKLPFVVIGGAVLAPLSQARQRSIAWLAAIALVVLVSYSVPGPGYVADLSGFAASRARSNWSGDWLVIAPLLGLFTAALLAFRRSYFGVAWLFHQMAPLAAPWYLFWGAPYALASGRLELYLVSLPLAATLAELQGPAAARFLTVLFAVLALDMLATRLRRTGSAASAATP